MAKVLEKSALDLYGGEKSVHERMALEISRGLRSKCEEIQNTGKKKNANWPMEIILVSVSDKLGIPLDMMTELYAGSKTVAEKVDYDLFDRLEFPLDLGIFRVLGEPDLNNLEVREYWENQTKVHPMTPGPYKDHDEEFKLYLGLRAIHELGNIKRLA